ncbi:MAG: TetR/AcrR family transcriptional regulator [Myxococcota bacterium]
MSGELARREPRQARSRQKVTRILAAARRILEQEGSDALNTNHIASEAGVGVGSVYEYFPDKHAIAKRVLDELPAEEAEVVIACFDRVAGQPLGEAIREVVSTVYDLYVRHHGLYRSIWALAPRGRRVGDRPGEVLIQKTVRQWLEPHVHALGIDDLDLAVFTTFHIVESLAMQMAARPGQWSKEAYVEQIVRVVHGYLRLH